MAGRLTHGDPRPFGSRMCAYGLHEPECDRSAEWHILWTDSNHTTSACEEHMQFILDTAFQHYACHRYGDVCDIPGTFWFTPDNPAVESHCYFGLVPSVRTLEAVEAWLGYDS